MRLRRLALRCSRRVRRGFVRMLSTCRPRPSPELGAQRVLQRRFAKKEDALILDTKTGILKDCLGK